jgi:regulator of RNase E activity RraA
VPVFARAAVPNAGGAEYAGEIGATIQCGGAVVHPGDWLLSDEDGIVVIPAGKLETSLLVAENLQKKEREIERRVRGGADLADLLRYDELLKAKSATGDLPQMRFTAGRQKKG